MSEIISQCSAGNRCKQWRVCEDCAKIRQARISNVAEQGSLTSPYITYAVVRPMEGNEFTKEKTNLIKHVSKVAEGGIWTVETGEHTGLHTNLIIGSSEPFNPDVVYKSLGVESSVWMNTNVDHREVRNIASYSSKQKGMPQKGEYSGNYYGSFGSWKKPLAVAAEQKTNPTIALMAIEQMLIDRSVPKPESNFMLRPLRGNETAKDIVKRVTHNKAEIERMAIANKHHEGEKNHYKNMQRSLAVLADEIELKGMAYLKGFGIVTERELKEFGIKCIT